MSTTLVDLSSDLSKLVEEEYDIEVREENLLVHHVPYVTSAGVVDYCILVSELTTNGEHTLTPGRHEVWVIGDIPHDHQGNPVSIIADRNRLDYGGGLVASCRLSGKPHGRMPVDYHEKISNYVRILGSFARALDPNATHKNYPVRETPARESVFLYHDAASSRAGLSAITGRLKGEKVAIVGLGGTGSYILDLVAKTPVKELHLYDDDVFEAHNAFRAPGAASLDELRPRPLKVDYLVAKYAKLHRGIYPHAVMVTSENVHELHDMSFVFLAIDAGPAKKLIIEQLEAWRIPFVDCGISVRRQETSLRGQVRVTTGLPEHYAHIPGRVSFHDIDEDEYDWNIQTADLNMLAAALAVLKWKKHMQYYVDSKHELNTSFTVATNLLVSGEGAS